MFMRRRRPLMRAAMVGGVAYHAGKRAQENRYEDEETEMRIQQLEAQQTAAPQASGGMSQSSIEQLKQLAELKQQGVLTDAEFEVQKQKLLQGV
jgi:serine kinase of HPr protein (carbohydrate metabolism regulator)